MTSNRVHFLMLDPGDLFRYDQKGAVFRRGPDTRDGRATVEAALGHGWRPAVIQEYEGCFVIPIDDDEPEDGPCDAP